jgi:DNA polymerase I-like protein with 3'-5' exonuclease and polymerase domains
MKQADAPAAKALIQQTLLATKIQTIAGIYSRLQGGPDGRIRTKLAPYTETGRLRSGEDPWWPEPTTNLQNLPKKMGKLDPLYEVRNCIVPSPGCVFIEGDLKLAEALATAAYAADWAKVDRLLHADEHRTLAAKIYDIPEDAVDKETHRQIGKMANHSLNYGSGWLTFMEAVNKDADITGLSIDAKMATRIIHAWQQMNPKTVRWWADVKRQVASSGELTNCFGRRRIFLSQRGAGNDQIAYLPQSTIADLLNAALVRLYALESAGFKIVLQIHDAILVEAPAASWAAVARLLQQTMLIPLAIGGRQLTVPVDISMSAVSWGKMKEIKL